MTASANPSPAEIVAALQRGGIVEALKLVIAARGNSSLAARQVADHAGAQTKLFRSPPLSSARADLSPGEVPRSSSDIWLLLVVAALCITYYFFVR
jgi:hypothetical protein